MPGTNGVSVAPGTTIEQLMAQLEQAKAENAALEISLARAEAQRNSGFTLKISDKGCICAYGLGRYPVALYASQWRKLLANVEKVQAFMDSHKGQYPENRAE